MTLTDRNRHPSFGGWRRVRHGVATFATVTLALLAVTNASVSTSTAVTGAVPTVDTIPPTPPAGPAPRTRPSTGAAWTEAGHDARHSGQASVVGPQDGTVRWSRNLGAPIAGGPAVATDGTIYAFSNAGVLHAIDPATGKDKWTFAGHGSSDNGQDLSTTPAILSDGTVLWPGPGSSLYALSPTGQLRWTLHLRGTVLSPAVASNGRVYVSDSDGDLVALQPGASSAGRRWTITIGTSSYGSPAVGPNGAIYVTADDSLYALRDDGSKASDAWKFATRGAIEVSASVAADGTIVVGTNDAYEYGVSPQGKVVWKYPRKVFSYSTPAVPSNGLAYFGDNDGYVDVVHANTGAVVGRYNGTARPLSSAGDGVWTAPLVDAHDDVYFGTAAGHVFGYTYTGRRLFNLSVGATVDSYPALTDTGDLVIGASNGTLYDIG
jgi:outer membrane protein assembly factor BamB